MNLGIILPLAIYLVFIFGAALFAYVKRSKSDFLTEYYVGNRSMTGFVLAMTTASTYASASSFVGGPGAAYKYGLGWVLLAMIQVPAVWLALGALGKSLHYFLAKPMRLLSMIYFSIVIKINISFGFPV